MKREKASEKQKELDSFLRSADESRRSRPNYDNWEDAPSTKYKRRNSMGVAIVLGVVVLLVILFWLFKEMKGFKGGALGNIGESKNDWGSSADTLKIDQGKYQAVFLTNGQVYFGKINSHNNTYIELVDIFYLQVKPVLQQGDESNSNNNSSQNQKTELSLVKLGNELHGPLDRMMINKDQVVFVEDLKDDSKVTDAIKRYQEGQK